MFRRTFYPDRFLESVYGTEPFVAYCRDRAIPFSQRAGRECRDDDCTRWGEALATLPAARRAAVELELAQVNELATRDSVYHLIEAGAERGLPPEFVAGEDAQALWFLVHQPEVFEEVFFHEEVLEAESWQNALAAPGLAIPDDRAARDRLEAALARFFREAQGTGRFCHVRSYRFREPDCAIFAGYVSDRVRLLDGFSDSGEHRRQRVRPATTVLFAYYPADGTVLLRTRYRDPKKVLALLRGFTGAVLGCDVDERSLNARYDLDRLKRPFDPPLPEGIAGVRVKGLELAYPAAEGRRRVRLETNAADRPSAVPELLAAHAGSPEILERLRVVSAELQVTLRVRGRPKAHVIRLWPNRCSLSRTPTAEQLRRCLASWGLANAPRA